MFNRKLFKPKNILYTIISIFVLILLIQIIKLIRTENYSTMSFENDYEKQNNLYKEDVGVIGTRKNFSHMRRPHLNPILVPVNKGNVE
jgi:uncharacterized membrane-anchored protein YitT (DUF2179 family)